MLLISSILWHIPFRQTVLAAAVVVGIVPSGLFLTITNTYSRAAIRLAGQDVLIL